MKIETYRVYHITSIIIISYRSAHGFTSGKEGRLGVPEWHPGKGIDMKLQEDAELWEVFSDGREILRGVYDTELKRFVKVINL